MKNFFLLSSFLVFSLSYSQIIYVNQNAEGENNGTSWENAYIDLDFAIHNSNKGEIWLARGTYIPSTDLEGNVPTNEYAKTFKLKKGIEIYGGFLGNELKREQRDWENNLTVLSGDVGVTGDLSDNAYHVVSSEYTKDLDGAILDGLTIKDGYAYFQESGAGIYVQYAPVGTFIIRNCIIENNYSFREGGGMYIFNSKPIIENNIFRNNQSFRGGAIYLYYSSATIKNNMFINNRADNYEMIGSSSLSGGAINVSSYASPIISNNAIIDNYAAHEGGGITIDNNYHVVFQNNFVSENSSNKGGGIFLENSESFFFNNVIHKNNAEQGGGIYIDYTPQGPQFINNTIIDNNSELGGGAMYLLGSAVNIVNSIFYNNSPSDRQIVANSYAGNWAPKIQYSSFENGELAISSYGNELLFENNFETTPIFVDAENNNFAIHENAQLINSGTVSNSILQKPWRGSNDELILLPNTDFAGNPRIIDYIDLGAYEFQNPLSYHSIEKNNNPLIVPNPSNGNFKINLQNYHSIHIYDLKGQKIKTILNTSKDINAKDLPNGIYLIVVEKDKLKYFEKLIIKK